MSDHTYRVTEIVGTSHEGVDQAIRNGIARASQTLRNLDWFEITQVRGQIEDGQIEHYQVGLKVGFRLRTSADADRRPPGPPATQVRPSRSCASFSAADVGRPARPYDPEARPLGVVADQLVVVHEDADLTVAGEPAQDLQLGACGRACGRRCAASTCAPRAAPARRARPGCPGGSARAGR